MERERNELHNEKRAYLGASFLALASIGLGFGIKDRLRQETSDWRF